MAAIFQIRRGDSSNTSSLVNGELYLNTAESALQVGTSTAGVPIKMLSLNTASFGDIILTGSAYISGNVVLGGNIYLGDNLANDSVNVNSPFSGSIIPSGSNVFDLGSTTLKYRNVYATSISGAIAATNGVVSGSSQILGGSGIVSGAAQVTPLLPTGLISGSSQVLGGTNIVSGSQQIIGILSSLNEVSSSLISKTGSYATTGSNSFNGNQSVNGNIYLTGSIIPSGSTIFDLGTETNPFRHLYASSGSIYMDGTRVIGAETRPVKIGDTHEGGIVFYIDSNSHCLIIDSEETGRAQSQYLQIATGATGTAIGTGQSNTNLIMARSGSASNSFSIGNSGLDGEDPAYVCHNLTKGGFSDWFLPSVDEMKQVGVAIPSLIYQGFDESRYHWTSTINLQGSGQPYSYFTVDGNGRTGRPLRDPSNGGAAQTPFRAIRRSTNLTIIGGLTLLTNTTYSGSITTLDGLVNGINISSSFVLSNERITELESSSVNLNSFTASLNISVTNLNTFSGSQLTQNSALATTTGSLISSASADRISIAELNSYTSSLKTAITASGGNVTINGNLTVKGTTTQIDSTTLNIGDNIIELNGASSANGGLLVKDTTGASGSLLWDSTLDYWKGGTLANESKILLAGGDSVISSSAQLTQLNSFTGSQLTQNTNLATISGSLILTASANTISITNLNSFSSSQLSQNTALATISGSLISSASSDRVSITNINLTTASLNISVTNLNSFTSSQLTQNTTLGSYTGSVETRFGTLGTLTGSNAIRLTNLESTTASLNTSVTNLNTFSSSQLSKDATLATLTASYDGRFTTLGNYTASVNQTTSSLNSYTASANVWSGTIDTRFTTLQQVTASLQSATASLFISSSLMTASIYNHEGRITYIEVQAGISTPYNFDAQFLAIAQVTGSLNSFTSSANVRLNNLEAATSSYETKGRGIVSGSSQIIFSGISSLPTLVSGSSQVLGGSGVWSGSAQLPSGVVSGSSQVLGGSGVWSGSAQLPSGVVSGSSQVIGILDSLNTFSGSANTRFTEIGVVSGSLIASASAAKTTNDSQGVSITNLNLTTASLNTSVSNLNTSTSSYETKGRGIVSGSSQVLGGSGVASGSYETTGRSIISSSAQIVPLLPAGVVSGSTQIITANSITLGTHTTGNYVATIAGTTNQITVAGSGLETAAITLSTPQDIHTSATPQFSSLGIGTAASGVGGEIRATGDIVAFYSSDERLKSNIQPIGDALDKVNQISGNVYDWKEGFENIHSHTGTDIGVIAQEIEKVLPQAVIDRENGYKAVNYEKIVPLLIEAIKELSAKVKELENK
jgi:hypothetical protein